MHEGFLTSVNYKPEHYFDIINRKMNVSIFYKSLWQDKDRQTSISIKISFQIKKETN